MSRVTMDTTDAQVTDPAPEGQDSPAGENSPQVEQTPVQKRFGEITAEKHAMKAQMDQMMAMSQQLMAQNQQLVAQLSARNAPTPPVAPSFNIELPADIDPNTAKLVTGMTQTFQKVLEHSQNENRQLIASISRQFGQAQAATDFQLAAQGQPPVVAQHAAKLLEAWQAKGYTGWAPADAIKMARIELIDAGQLQPGQAPAQRRGFQAQNQDLAPGGGGAEAPNPRAPARATTKALSDAEFNRLSLAKKEEYLAARVGDTPIDYQ